MGDCKRRVYTEQELENYRRTKAQSTKHKQESVQLSDKKKGGQATHSFAIHWDCGVQSRDSQSGSSQQNVFERHCLSARGSAGQHGRADGTDATLEQTLRAQFAAEAAAHKLVMLMQLLARPRASGLGYSHRSDHQNAWLATC